MLCTRAVWICVKQLLWPTNTVRHELGIAQHLRTPVPFLNMRKNAYIFLLVGLALFTFLIGYYGFSDVVAALIVCGWGLLWITLYHLVPVFASSLAWCSLWMGSTPPPLAMMVRLRWIGECGCFLVLVDTNW